MKKAIHFSPITFFLLLSVGILLLIYPFESRDAAQEGLRLCYELIIPSLFPFFVLSSLFISMGYVDILSRWFTPLMWPIFRLGGSCSAALLLGVVGGYPVGLRTSSELYEQKLCTRAEFLHLSAFCNNCGPAFLITVAGVGIFHSKTVGLILFFAHLVSAFLVGFLFRFLLPNKDRNLPSEDMLPSSSPQRFSDAFPICVRQAFFSTLHISAFVTFFFVFLRLLSSCGFLPWLSIQLLHLSPGQFTSALCDSLLYGTFELSSGIDKLSETAFSPIALPLTAWILSWGGLSVHCQSISFLSSNKVSSIPYFIGKFLHGLFAAALTMLLFPLLHPSGLSIPASSFAFRSASPFLQLLQQEFLALWVCVGLYCLLRKLR